MMLKKIMGIKKLEELGLPTPPTVFISNLEEQVNELSNFLIGKDYVMIRSDSEKQSTHCPRNLKCSSYEARRFVQQLNNNGYTAIVQDYVPINNRYSGNILILNNSFIIESMNGGPVSKLNREGLMHEHLRTDKEGNIIMRHGSKVIPEQEVKAIINRVKDLPAKNHILEFSSGPDWFYFWHARKDPTSVKLDT